MNVPDIILLICLVPALVQGFMKGFLSQAFELAALVAGAWTAYHFSWTATHWLLNHIQASAAILHLILFVLILIVAFYIFNLVGQGLRRIIRVVVMGWIDKLLGIFFAFLKAGLVIGLFIVVFHTINTRFGLVPARILDESVLYGPLKDITYSIFPYFKEILTF